MGDDEPTTPGEESVAVKTRSAGDPRIDRAAAWLIPFLVTLAVAYLGSQVSTLNTKIDTLMVKIAVLEAGKYSEQIEKIEARLRELERARGGAK